MPVITQYISEYLEDGHLAKCFGSVHIQGFTNIGIARLVSSEKNIAKLVCDSAEKQLLSLHSVLVVSRSIQSMDNMQPHCHISSELALNHNLSNINHCIKCFSIRLVAVMDAVAPLVCTIRRESVYLKTEVVLLLSSFDNTSLI